MGLYHTFQGGCTGTGDYVARHAGRGLGGLRLPDRSRHLHGAPGNDPIKNFMDYTDDACMDRFTPGQATRMQAPG